jgi:hypothetical protein
MEHFPTKERLHSDVLEEKYGPIHSEVLRHDDVKEERDEGDLPMREAHLCDGNEVSRTYALTFLTYDKADDEFYEIDSEIRNGGMIGKAFREHEFVVKKNVIDVFTLPLTPELKEKFKTDIEYAKARFSEFYARRGNEEPKIYGRVLEVYTPDFREPIINEVDIAQVNPSTDIMAKNSITKEEIWDHLDRASEPDEWEDQKEAYESARTESLPEVFAWRKKVESYLNKTGQ